MQGLRHELWTFCKAQFSALVATLADFTLAILLAEVCEMWYVGATFSGAVVGGIVNCSINYEWVFDNTHQMQKREVAIRYLLVWCGSILLNTGGTYLLTEYSGQHFILAKAIVAICIAVFWNYQLQRNFVYKLKSKN